MHRVESRLGGASITCSLAATRASIESTSSKGRLAPIPSPVGSTAFDAASAWCHTPQYNEQRQRLGYEHNSELEVGRESRPINKIGEKIETRSVAKVLCVLWASVRSILQL